MGGLTNKGIFKQAVNRVKFGNFSEAYTGIDPSARQGTNTGSPPPRGRGGVRSSKKTKGPGPAKTPLSL